MVYKPSPWERMVLPGDPPDPRRDLVEALHLLLKEHERQAVNPSLWQDNAWKGTYYGLLNKVQDALESLVRR